MPAIDPRTVRVHFSGNQGTDARGSGVRYDYVNDAPTDRKDVLGFVVGGKPRDGKLPRGAKALLLKQGEIIGVRGSNIVQASVVTETVGGQERFALAAYDGKKMEDLIRMHTGLDFEQGSTANHKMRLESEGKTLYPHGFVPYDADVLELIKAESGDLPELEGLLPSLPGPKATSDVRLIGKKHHGGKYIPSIECSEFTDAVYYLGPRGVGFKGYIWGPVVLVKRVEGVIVEQRLADSQRRLFEKLLFSQRDQRRAEVEKAKAERLARLRPLDLDDAARG